MSQNPVDKTSVFSPIVKSWVLGAIMGIIIPLFAFPFLLTEIKNTISRIPMNVETGYVYSSGETIGLVVIMLVIFVLYLVVILYQIWLSAVKVNFLLSLPIVLTLAGPVAIVLISELL